MDRLKHLLYRLNRRIIRSIVRPRTAGTPPQELLAYAGGEAAGNGPPEDGQALAPLLYVLETRSLSDLIVLDLVTEQLGLPSPLTHIELPGIDEDRRFFFLNRASHGWFRRNTMSSHSQRMVHLMNQIAAEPRRLPGAIVPVGIFWGRAPAREGSLWRQMMSENWAVTSRLRRMTNLFVSRRDIVAHFGPPLPLAELVGDGYDGSRTFRRAARLLRVRIRNLRVASMGPDLSHQRTVAQHILHSRAVREVIEAAEPADQARLEAQAERHAREIASNLSHSTIRIIERLLRWFWNRIYQGVNFYGGERLTRLAEEHTLIYVPSHRSHLDYLLLSYLVYQHGLMVPHIASGDNLNQPVLGSILRRGGAFFMRRSFRDDPLYSAVFSEYLYEVYRRGHSVEFFPEGGRTRTGRLLPARIGLLKMTLEHHQRGVPRPLALVPVYIGYEKLVEAGSYLDELQGAEKQRESLADVFRSLRLIRQNFGVVDVKIGQPLVLDDWIAQVGTAGSADSGETALALGHEVMRRINAAAALNPINLVALVTLCMPRLAVDERTLVAQIDCYQRLLQCDARYHDYQLPDTAPEAMIAHVESLGMLNREQEAYGSVLSHRPFTAVLMTWYRNNVVHVLALPSLLACLVRNRRRPAAAAALQGMCATVFPYIADELQTAEDARATGRWLGHLSSIGLLRCDGEGAYSAPPAHSRQYFQLRLLARLIMPTLERLYIVVGLLHQGGQGSHTRPSLQQRSHEVAQKMSRLYGINAPEFFDAGLFNRFVDALLAAEVIAEDGGQRLVWAPVLEEALKAAEQVIEPDFRFAVYQETARPA